MTLISKNGYIIKSDDIKYVEISNFKNIFTKGQTPKKSKEVFVIKEVKNTTPWANEIEKRVEKYQQNRVYSQEVTKKNVINFMLNREV